MTINKRHPWFQFADMHDGVTPLVSTCRLPRLTHLVSSSTCILQAVTPPPLLQTYYFHKHQHPTGSPPPVNEPDASTQAAAATLHWLMPSPVSRTTTDKAAYTARVKHAASQSLLTSGVVGVSECRPATRRYNPHNTVATAQSP